MSVALHRTTPVALVAQTMRDDDIGDVLVLDGNVVRGVLTDRDLVVRVVAAGLDAETTMAGHVCSPDVTSIRPDSLVDEAVHEIRQRALRRLPVIDAGDRAVGVASLGDVAIDREPSSALADISAAPPNR